MDDQEGLDKLFFELASESRLGILLELQKKDHKNAGNRSKAKSNTYRNL